jgi:hypothetical protein
VNSTGGFCLACRKPFDEVHPLDFTNDWKCSDINAGRSQFYPPDFPLCMKDHTWREHVQESYERRGQVWINLHVRVETMADDRVPS